MLDEEGREDRADGAQAAQESGGDAIEAHRRDGGLRAAPLLKAGQIQHSRARARQRARNGHGQDDIELAAHAAVFGSVTVQARGAQLIAQARLGQQHPDGDGAQDSQRDGDGHVGVVVKQLFQAQAGQRCRGVGALEIQCVGAGRILHLRQQGIDRIEADPVEHDAGNNLVHVAIRLERAGYGAQQRAAHDGRQQAYPPGQLQRQRAVQACTRAGHILARRADIEQAYLIGKEHRQRAHQQRRSLYQRGAQIFQLGLGAAVGPEILQYRQDGLRRTGGIDNQQRDIADQHACDNAQ